MLDNHLVGLFVNYMFHNCPHCILLPSSLLTLSVSPSLTLFLSLLLTHGVLFSLQGKRKKRKRDNKTDSTPEGEDRYTHSHRLFYLALFVSNLALSSLLCDMQLMKSSASTGRYVCGLRGRSHRTRPRVMSAFICPHTRRGIFWHVLFIFLYFVLRISSCTFNG